MPLSDQNTHCCMLSIHPLTVHSLSGPHCAATRVRSGGENDKLAKWSTIEQNRRNNLWLSAEHHHQRPIRHQTCLSLCNTGEQAFFEGKRRRNEVKNLLICHACCQTKFVVFEPLERKAVARPGRPSGGYCKLCELNHANSNAYVNPRHYDGYANRLVPFFGYFSRSCGLTRRRLTKSR